MAFIVPLRGIQYDSRKVRDLRLVVAPPYDVISPAEQDALYQRHPQNVIRLILNKETPEDTPQNSRYTRSATFYRQWLAKGILTRTSQPLYYFLQEEFDFPFQFLAANPSAPRRVVRRGFIGLIRLEDFGTGAVLPHEKTQNKPKADRLALMEACQANLSQIFSLYSDPASLMDPIYEEVFSDPAGPTLQVTDDDEIRHSLWLVSKPDLLARVSKIMRPKEIFIADGHHRYETALAYRNKQCASFHQNTGQEPYSFTMMYFSSMEDPGILIFPTHRVVNLPDFSPSSFLEKIEALFTIEKFPFASHHEGEARGNLLQEMARRADQGRSLGMFLKEAEQFFLLSLKSDQIFQEIAPGLSPVLKALDVNLLHMPILQGLFKIGPEELSAGKYVLYFKEPGEAFEAVQSGKGRIAFFLNPTRVYQVRDVSLAKETMPSKSTFFYPKLLSSLVINPLDPHEQIIVP